MANKRTIKKALNDMIFDVVDECYHYQMNDDSKAEQTNKLIDEAAFYMDDTLSKINAAKSKADFKPIKAGLAEKAEYFVNQLNSLN